MTPEIKKTLDLALEALYPIAHNSTDDPCSQAYKAITAIKRLQKQKLKQRHGEEATFNPSTPPHPQHSGNGLG